MNDPKTILIVSSRTDIAGGENYLLSVMRHLDRHRFEPLVVLPGIGKFHHALKNLSVASEIVEVDYNGILQQGPWYKLLEGADRRINRIVEIIRANNVSLVHTNSNKILDGAFAARIADVPHLYLAHIEYQPNLPIFERIPLQPSSFAELIGGLSDGIIAVSEGVARALCPPLDRSRIRVICNGLEFDHLDEAAVVGAGNLRDEIGVDEKSLLVTAVGRVHPDKGFDCLLEAAAQVIFQQSINAHFLIAGAEDDRMYAGRLREQMKELKLDRQVHFLGFRDDVPRILSQSDVFVLSSRREGHPYVLLEAMASGCASVATRCNGVEDTVADGQTALLVNIGDITGLANAIGRLARDGKFRRDMASAGRAGVRARFAAKTSVESLMDVYEEILGSPRGMASSIGIDLFLRAVHEIGGLGLKVAELERRVRQVEHLTHWVRQSPIYKSARQVKRWIRGAVDEG
jgi:glycosyltransferase involved in cell wall biosynthesis